MSKTSPSPLAAIRDVPVGTTVDGAREDASSAIGDGLTLAKAAAAHLTVQSASWRLADRGWMKPLDEDDLRARDAAWGFVE